MDARTRQTREARSTGSALILTVVLTTVLAIVGILFVMLSRMDRISATASSQARQLDLAVDAVIAAIDDQLAQDTPGVVLDQAGMPVAEYEDYPNARDLWLASLEPDPNGGKNPFWPQVSVLQGSSVISRLRAEIVTERQAIDPNESQQSPADADGDGVADAVWVKLQDVATGKAQPVYAAVRIIDHGAMLNVNSAYTLDAAGPVSGQDGSNQMQIDLVAMAMRKVQDANAVALSRELNNLRTGGEDPCAYLSKVVWDYGDPPAPFCPFDLSDELELRNRFLLNNREGTLQASEVVVSRIERLWRYSPKAGSWVFCPAGAESKDVPYDDPSGDIPKWLARAAWVEPGGEYDYRHVSTTMSMDRVIDPLGRRTLNVNTIRDANDVNDLYQVLVEGGMAQAEAAQVAVNIRDFVDSDTTVSPFKPAGSAVTYYGMEPQPFIRQIGFKISGIDPVNQANNEFMVELHNPYDVDIDLSSFTLFLLDSKDERAGLVAFKNGEQIKARQSLVLINKAAATLGQGLGDRRNYDSLVLALYGPQGQSFALSLKRDLLLVRNAGGLWVDRQRTDGAWFDWSKVKDLAQYYARENGGWKILYPRMPRYANAPFLFLSPKYNLPQPQPIVTVPASAAKGFATLGDVGRIFRIGPSVDANSPTGLIHVLDQTPQPSEDRICLNVADPCVAGVFQRLTVLAPERFGHAATETRVKGRINVNTAPAFVLERLPWLAWASDTKLKGAGRMGQAIVADREVHGPFRSISDLMRVPEMECLMDTVNDQSPNGPDLTADSEPNDLEERDLLFDRISNLVTVRSDVFSACILVRIGVDGPQRRVLAILDRSGVTRSGGKVQCLALHVVPDPR